MPNLARLMLGLLVAALIATLARRAHALSVSGAVAATLVGTVAIAAGWDWGVLLIAFFVASSLLSRVHPHEKQRATNSIVAKGNERDATQVLANGALFAAAALAFVASPTATWQAVGAGALAAATADTWATEIGMHSLRPPRSIITWRRLPAGTSGGVTLLGIFGTVLGAAFIQMTALLLRWPEPAVVAALVGGIAGAIADSFAGALLQQRRWCDQCAVPTERRVHVCGTPTRISGGIAFLDNDGVNLVCTMSGAAVAYALVGYL